MSVNERSASQGQTAAFQPEDLLRQAQIQDAALSPDGSNVVYSRRVIADNAYRTHLWIVPWSGGDARQLTHAAVNDTRPVFSPDGRSLAFISDRGGRAAALDLAPRRRRTAPGGRHCGGCDSRPLVARWATAADYGPQRRRTTGGRGSAGPDRAGDRRFRLETGRSRVPEPTHERVGGSGRWRRAAPRDQRGLGDSRCTMVAGWRAPCGRRGYRTRCRDAPAQRAGSCLAARCPWCRGAEPAG